MQLLWPESNLAAIAVEGLSPTDQGSAATATIDIADITLYFGRGRTFESASRTSVVQFKYSVADSETEFRISHAKETIAKFAQTYLDYRRRYGDQAVQNKLDFELITNRPIYNPLLQAIHAIANGSLRGGEIQAQAKQFKTAAGLDGKALAAFAAKCRLIGLAGSLPTTKNELSTLIVNWSATRDPIASMRLGELKQMVRDKAGHAGTNQNLISRTDVLAALHIGDLDDLLPCRPAMPDVGNVIEREQLAQSITLIPELVTPLLIHAAGGVGKTVFMNSLASAIRDRYEVVFFDCFGGGAYRSPHDARHLPRKGLIHIANTLAFRSLCDPILPDSPDEDTLLRAFRQRLTQSADTLSRMRPGRGLVLFIDAIDNAALIANQRTESSFPTQLMESLDSDPIPGLTLIVSCRTERKPSTYARYREFELLPFSIAETSKYLKTRLKNVSGTEVKVAWARSGGNPRVLEYLVKSGRGLLDESDIKKKVELDDLIQDRISHALFATIERGYAQEDIDAFLAGLSVLPPPVPLDEYAAAHGIEVSAIESFASDLRPLLERTNHGLMFRDEPTETYIYKKYASIRGPLERVAKNLLARQDISVYAARALPGLLHKLDDGHKLFELAFDARTPASIASTMGKRNIRYARLKAASLHAAINQDYNRLVRLLLELSTIAAVDHRGTNYIRDYPDLVVAARDIDAKRRLFEMRTGWPGTRHARLTIANLLAGASEEAYRHSIGAYQWIEHYLRMDREVREEHERPDHCDIAAIPFFLVCHGDITHATSFLKGWKDWYSYEVCELIFHYLRLATILLPEAPRGFGKFVNSLTEVGPLSAALSFHEFTRNTRKDLIARLSKACKKATKLDVRQGYQHPHSYTLEDGLRKASAHALWLGLPDEALTISRLGPHKRPDICSFRNHSSHDNIFPFIFHTALIAAAKGQALHEKDVLPMELVPVCASISRTLTDEGFRVRLKERLPKFLSKESRKHGEKPDPRMLSHEEKPQADNFIERRLQPLLALTRSLARFLSASPQRIDGAFMQILEVWESARKNRNEYDAQQFDNLFRLLGLEITIFAFWARRDLKHSSVKHFLTILHGQNVSAQKLTQIVSILAQRPELEALAGEEAQRTRVLIESEDDVLHRASHFANLGRAMLPASIDDAAVYFRDGLEQMDAIGSRRLPIHQ